MKIIKSIYNKIKNNKSNVVIVLLALFGLNRCTVACNRDMKFSKSEKTIDTLSAKVSSQKGVIDSLNRDIVEYQNVIKLYKGFDQDKQNLITTQNQMQQEQLKALRSIQSKINKK